MTDIEAIELVMRRLAEREQHKQFEGKATDLTYVRLCNDIADELLKRANERR